MSEPTDPAERPPLPAPAQAPSLEAAPEPAPALDFAAAERSPAALGAPAALDGALPVLDAEQPSLVPPGERPSFVFFGVVSAVSLIADVLSKAWAQIELSARTQADPSLVLIKDHLTFTLALNRGGAWGLMSNASDAIRHPFFFLVSALAIGFIVSLYGRLGPGQRALKWGLPLVLGGALGNFSDRVVRSSVIDFIDYRADWIEAMNRLIAKAFRGWAVTDHWPTFNVADISICIGVGLMAIDMFTSRRGAARRPSAAAPAPAPHA